MNAATEAVRGQCRARPAFTDHVASLVQMFSSSAYLLPAKAFLSIGLDYVEGEFPGSSFCAVRFRGEVEQLNAILYKNGLNALCC